MKAFDTARTPLVLLLAGILSACASTGSLVEAPAVELTGVELTSASLKRQTFLLDFHVDNPNPFPLPVRAVTYRVLFDNEKFAGGETAGSFSVPANGGEAFSISVDLDVLKSATRFSSLLRSGLRDDIAYELSGTLELDLPLVKPLPFSNSGTVNLTKTASSVFD